MTFFIVSQPIYSEIYKVDPYIVSKGKDMSPLDPEDFLKLALLFSGVDSKDVPKWVKAIHNYSNPIIDELLTEPSVSKRAEALLLILHNSIFKKYREEETRLTILYNDGIFNCVSSSVMYMYMAEKAGITIVPVATPDHAFCSIYVNDQIIDIETTTKYGFNPGEKKEFTNAFGDITGFSYVPPGHYTKRWDVSDKELLGFILSNQISLLQRQQKFDQTVPLAMTRNALEQTPESEQFLEDTFKNWGAFLNMRNQYLQGISAMKMVEEEFPHFNEVKEVAGILVYNRLVSLINNKQTQKAQNEWSQYKNTIQIDQINRDKIDKMMKTDDLQTILKNGDFETARQYLKSVEKDLSKSQINEYTTYLYSKEAKRIETSEGMKQAYHFLKSADPDILKIAKVKSILDMYEYNYIISIHNNFATLFNAGRYEEAQTLLNSVDELVRKSSRLQQDQKLLDKQR